MKIKDKVYMNRASLIEEGPITIVAFGDSVTHGALQSEINYETVYWNRLKQKINNLRSYVPVNVINAGIAGLTAKDSLSRLEKQVLRYSPDLIIVSFGLNDVHEPLEDYLSSLKIIFEKSVACAEEVIFMTPNMFNTYVDESLTGSGAEIAQTLAHYQNNGRMDLYMNSAMNLARELGVKVCDCYSKWKKLSETEDTTKLLVNRINHPEAHMHELFADSLFEVIFEDSQFKTEEIPSTMYQK